MDQTKKNKTQQETKQRKKQRREGERGGKDGIPNPFLGQKSENLWSLED